MNQVTCGESKALITIQPGEPKEYYVSDLVERLNIKIDLKGTSGIEAVVTDPEGNLLSSDYAISSEGECIDAYIVCYEILILCLENGLCLHHYSLQRLLRRQLLLRTLLCMELFRLVQIVK